MNVTKAMLIVFNFNFEMRHYKIKLVSDFELNWLVFRFLQN